MHRYVLAILAGVSATAALSACGGDDTSTTGGGDRPNLVVSAASSLTEALTECSRSFEGANVRLSFAGSDELAAQIRQGVAPDVFASANTTLPDELHAEGLVERPEVFASNELVLAVPADSAIASVDDLAREGVTIAMGSETVPIGSYTREVLSRLPAGESEAILANVRSNEPDVKGIVGKLTQGAVDGGFVYATDVTAAGDELKAIALPAGLRPSVDYGVAVVRDAEQPELAADYVAGLTDGPCAEALDAAGFGSPER